MKNRLIGVVFSFILLSFVSCDKIEEALNFGMSANIDSEKWVSVTRLTVLNNNKFTITGTSANGKILVITIDGNTTGTYTLNPLISKTQCGCTYKESISAASTDWYLGSLGTVNLTEVNTTNKTISGTFEFTLVNLSSIKSVTGGEFKNLSYQ